MSKPKAIALVRLVDIERGLFQFVFFNENETERIFGYFGATWDDKKLNFLFEDPGSWIINGKNFSEILKQTGK